MKKLSLSDYANIAEVLACAMVIVSLIYGINEYNRMRLIDVSEIDDLLYQSAAENNRAIITNDVLANIVFKAEYSSDSLTPLEKSKYTRLRFVFFNDWEKAFTYHKEGRMNDETWQDWLNAFSIEVAEFPDFMWKENKSYFPDPEFQALVEGVLEDAKGAD